MDVAADDALLGGARGFLGRLDAMPALRRTISASARSPLASIRAFLHSIMPAPVRSRSSFTSCALISIASCRFLSSVVRRAGSERVASLQRAACRRDYSTVCGVLPTSSPASDARTLARQRHGRQIFVRQTFRHELIELLRIELRVLRDFLDRSFVGDDLLGGEILFGGERAAFDHRVGDLGGEQPDGAQRVVVARNHVIHFVRIAVGVDHGDHRDAQLARFLHRDRFLVRIDHEQHVRQARSCP